MANKSTRIVVLILLGFLAMRSINIRGMEEASADGNTAALLGHVAAPLTFVLAMLVIIFWPWRAKG
jgi:hypothetical protein